MWRKGVAITCPEGTRWSCIPLPQGKEVKSLSCGVTGLVWAVLWTGNILVREGITPATPMGKILMTISYDTHISYCQGAVHILQTDVGLSQK